VASAPSPARVSIYDAAAANRVRTAVLLVSFVFIVVVLAYFVGEYLAGGSGVAIVPIAFLIAVGSAWVSYFAGDKLILAQSRARELGPDEEKVLRDITETLAVGLGVPAPRLYVIEDSAPNAFATGRDPAHASLVVTRGLLQKMDRTELEGVLAHELSHVGNRDIRVMLLVTVLVGTVALIADMAWRAMFWGGGSRGRDRDRGGGGAILAIVALVLLVISPIIAQLIQLAVSRQREYLADASGALLTRYPPGLASALRKIAADTEVLEAANKATASLYIANPLKDAPAFFDHLFDTHPPIEERIRRLEAMG